MKMDPNIPYKTYLEESELPQAWYNLRADMKNKPAPLLNPATLEPMTAKDLAPVFCDELVRQELDNDTALFPIPQPILDCIVPPRWYVHIFWNKRCKRRQKFIINLRAITPPAVTSSTARLHRHIMQKNKASKV